MHEDVYRKLAEHLDRLPGGFGPSETDADLRLLARLFTPQEAALATHLNLDREEARAIAGRAGLSPAEAARRLDAMALKGLIFSVQGEEGTVRYQAAPWVVGIYEFQVNRMSEGFLRDVAEYYRTKKPSARPRTIPQMRTIPVGESITPHLEALPYEQVNALVEAHDRFAVAPCICRRHARLEGRGCDAPEESCLMFGDFADYYVRTGRGRRIDRAEVQAILARADEANLVLQPTNSQEIEAICCCCSCCCGILGGLKRHPQPAQAVANAFRASLDAELCLGCFVCLDRCQMDALSEAGDRVALDAGRCIGCGLCTTTCPSEALTLVRKPEGVSCDIPVSFQDTWATIVRVQAEA